VPIEEEEEEEEEYMNLRFKIYGRRIRNGIDL
jgi:hypothetical protein